MEEVSGWNAEIMVQGAMQLDRLQPQRIEKDWIAGGRIETGDFCDPLRSFC
jgi:hypothetical protein